MIERETMEAGGSGSPPGTAEKADPPAVAEGVTELAFDLTTATLEGHGNQLSATHREALRRAVGLFTDVASGRLRGRYVLDLPTGLGKTTAMVCWAKAMAATGIGWSLAICASRVEELCDIHAMLTSGARPVAPGLIGLWHAKPEAPLRPTFRPGEERRYGERPILLLTHQRVRQGPSIQERLRFEGARRDLVVYDESLTTTDVQHASYRVLAGQLKNAWAALGDGSQVAVLLEQIEHLLDEEVAQQQRGGSPAPLTIPISDASTADLVLDEVDRVLGRDSELWRLINHGPYPARVVILGQDRKDATVVRFDVAVPDELDRMVVLDASYPVRRLLGLAGESLASSAPALRLTPVAAAPQPGPAVQAKRYDRVEIHWMATRGSGRTHAAEDLRNGVDGSAILAEIVAVLRTVPADEAVIVWTFLRSADDLPDFRGLLGEALRGAGIDTKAVVDVDGEAKPRIVVETFGRETASNAYKYCRNVVFMGCLEPARQQIAGQFVAEARDLLVEVPSALVDDLVRGEVHHRLYQVVSRAACREVTVDEQGRTQAKPTKVWVMTRHRTIEEDLAEVFPGAGWHPWVPTVPGNVLATKIDTAAAVVRRHLAGLDQPRIGLKTLKAQVEVVVGKVSNHTFQDARDLAIKDTPWEVAKQSLVRKQQ
jgi:hypothetical protein